MELNDIQSYLITLLSKNNIDKVFTSLTQFISNDSDSFNQIVQLSRRYEAAKTYKNLGTIDNENYDISVNKITHSLFHIITKISKKDLFEPSTQIDLDHSSFLNKEIINLILRSRFLSGFEKRIKLGNKIIVILTSFYFLLLVIMMFLYIKNYKIEKELYEIKREASFYLLKKNTDQIKSDLLQNTYGNISPDTIDIIMESISINDIENQILKRHALINNISKKSIYKETR